MKKLFVVFAMLVFVNTAHALPSMQSQVQEQEHIIKTEASFNILKPIKVQILKWNMFINKEIPKYMKGLKNNPSIWVVLTALFAATVYGILHTLGPGHGKMVVATYFLTQQASFWQGVFLGIQTAFAHVAGAIVLVFTTDLALRSLVLDPEQHMYLLRNISFGLIVLVGIVMLIQAILHATGKVKDVGCVHCNGHNHHSHNHNDKKHNHSHGHHHQVVKTTKKDTFIALSIGLIPCTGSLLILLYAMANDILLFGLLMVCFVAVGMSITMIVLGLLTILGKKRIVDKFFKDKAGHKTSITVETVGALFIIFIGSMLLWANM